MCPSEIGCINKGTIHFTLQLTSIDGIKCVMGAAEDIGAHFKCVSEGTLADFLLKSCFRDSLNLGFTLGSGVGSGVGLILALSRTPCSSYMMGLVPCATPQTFSRMVVLPALALPITRMRK